MQSIEAEKHQPEHVDNLHKTGSIEDEGITAYVPDSPEEKRLVRKIDKHLLPMLWLMYIMNYMTNIGNAKTGGMEADWKLTSSEYSIILSIFFVSYLLFEVPSNMILVRTRPSIFLPSIMAAWGALSVGVYGIHNFGGMVAFRFALGIIEAGFFPGVMLLMSCWYKPAELSKRVALFYTASLVAGAFGGLLAGGLITGMEGVGGVRGWKWLFIIEGVATVVFSIGAFFVLPDYPTTTKWLTAEEKELAVTRLMSRGEEAEEGDDMTHREALWAAVKDVKIWTFMLAYNVLNSVGTISYFFPTLMVSLGYTGRMSQFMTVPIYVVALIIALFMGWNADRTRRKALHIMVACTWGILSFVLVAAVPIAQVKYTFLCFGGAAVWSSVPLFLSWMITMFEGKEKRAVCIAIINGVGNLASIYGSFFWPSNTAPRYILGFSITTAFMGLCLAVTVFNYWKFGDKGWRHLKEQQRLRAAGH